MVAVPKFAIEVGAFDVTYKRWAEPQYESKGQVDRAGKLLINPESAENADDILTAFSVINNWRAVHSYPLHIAKVTLKARADSVSKRAISAQRLKRLSSIAAKLKRNPHMKLTQMQDIGGCRAIMPKMKVLRELIASYETAIAKNPPEKETTKQKIQIRSVLVEKYDYITNPKPDGYRSHHYVFKYQTAAKAKAKQIYNGLRVEIQLRTKLQHAWATSVEAISTFTEQALKSGLGNER